MIKAKFFLLISLMLFGTGNLLRAGEETKTESKDIIEKEGSKDLLDFSSIKDIIKKDGLEDELKKKQDEKRKYLDDKKLKDMKKYNVPNQDVFWSFFSELWLVKNATILKWDIHKPDFELEKAFTAFLESQGLYEKKIKILLLDSAEIAHAALPSNSDEYIFILSLPFIRTLDLSKVEISLILFEDFIRVKRGYFKNYVLDKEFENFLGSNFSGKQFDKKIIDNHLKKYNQVLFEKGFSFQEQFETTKEIDVLLKSDLKIWNTYLTLLEKIDTLTKNNSLYKKYSQIYPSPELQLNWLKPKNTIL
ncbi:MAG: hypothetical protein H7281_09905 [Bacteriovorax sp.]|nr:hypothetical protein [Bacteriovorax sp.]